MKKTWKIDIDCPNCAAKVERALQKLPGVVSASVNYVQKKITLEAADDRFEEVRKAAYPVNLQVPSLAKAWNLEVR